MTLTEVEDLMLRASARKNQFGEASNIDVLGRHLTHLERARGRHWQAAAPRVAGMYYQPLCTTVIYLCEQEIERVKDAIVKRLKS